MARTERYLAEGTRLVILPKTTRVPQWYNTRKEVVLDVEPEIVQCPLSGNRVHSFIYEGIRIFFPPNIVRSREIFEDGDIDKEHVQSMRPVLFTYDIPDDATEIVRGKERPFYNPSDYLRTFAVRLNLSCWVMNEGDVPHALISRMLDAGCDPYVFEFNPNEAGKLVGAAVATLKKEINAAIVRAEQAHIRAEAQLTNAANEEGISPEEAEQRFLDRANAISARMQSLTDDLNKVATRFGINPHVLSIDRLNITGGALKSTMEERARAYTAAANVIRETGTMMGEGLANAAAVDACPPYVMADFLRDSGKDAEADAITRAFNLPGGTPEPEPVPATAPTDEHIFSLVENDEDE